MPAWHQGHSARGGGDEGGQPRVAAAAPESHHYRCSGFGAGWRKGVLGIHLRFLTFLLDITPTLDAARGAVKPRGLWFGPLRFPQLLVASPCLGGVFAFGAGAGGGSHTRAHAHAQRRARGSGTGTICSVNAALGLKEGHRASRGDSPAESWPSKRTVLLECCCVKRTCF